MPEPVTPPANKDGADPTKVANQPSEREKELEAKLAQVEEDKLNLRKGLDEQGKKLNQIEQKLAEKADDVIKGDVSASQMTEQEIEDLKYMEKLGYVSTKKLDEVIAKVKEETKKETIGELTKEKFKERTEKEIDELAVKHTFIDKEQLKKYMSDRAESGTVLSADEAVTLLYKDKILADGIKPADLPGAEDSKKGIPEEPKPKVLELGSRAMSERIAERLNKVD